MGRMRLDGSLLKTHQKVEEHMRIRMRSVVSGLHTWRNKGKGDSEVETRGSSCHCRYGDEEERKDGRSNVSGEHQEREEERKDRWKNRCPKLQQ